MNSLSPVSVAKAQRQLLTRINCAVHVCGRKMTDHTHAVRGWLYESYLKTEKRKKTRECITQLRRERLLLLGNFKESAVLFWYVGRVWSLQLRLEVPRWREERLVPGAACLVAGAQRGRRGCRLLVGFALAPQLRSPCLPVLMSILPTGGFLQSVVSAD